MKTTPLVTIAIPTCNRADTYLPQALHSALGQTYSNLDIIVADNCSTDHTQAYVAKIKDPRLRYFRHASNIGQRGNYNFCFEQAKGTYLLLLHDDDTIDDDFVWSCIQASGGSSHVGVIRTGLKLINADGNVVAQITNDVVGLPLDAFFRGWFSGKTPIYCCNTLFNTQKLRETSGFTSKHFRYPDTMAIFRLAAQYPRIDIREVKASFRIHEGEFGFAGKIDEWCEDSLDLLDFMCDLVSENRDEIRKQGARFFARANYNRASSAGSPWQRVLGTIKVMKYFKYRQVPFLNMALHIFHGTRLYDTLRVIKRHAKRPFHSLVTD